MCVFVLSHVQASANCVHCMPVRCALGLYSRESGESHSEVSPPELGKRTHTLTGEVQQWLEEGKIQQHFLIYGL